jgi:Fur family ferric uptake transcriptional regulator
MLSKIEKLCLEKKVKLTGKRRIIAKIISDSNDHPDVEDLYQRAIKIDPDIGIATVYRTVRMFEEEGIITRHDFGNGKARYEEFDERSHHDHLIDVSSGKVIEFFNDEIEKLKTKIALDLGYKLIDHKLELYAVPLKQRNK